MLQEIIEKKKETKEPKIIFKGSDSRKRVLKNEIEEETKNWENITW